MLAKSTLAAALLLAAAAAAAATPLDDYVAKPDPSYKWNDSGLRINGDGWTGYVLNMTSQTWLTPEDFVGPYGHVWFHDMVVIVPNDLRVNDTGMLWITGGENSWNQHKFSASDEDVMVTATLAKNAGMVAAALFQIPNQHIVFAADPLQKQRSEDAAIAFTWRHFIDDSSRTEWPLRLPMTKAAVRALDTLGAFSKQHLDIDVTSFMAAGASKRGWTTWTLGAVDKRLKAIMPIVLDALHFRQFMHTHWRAYGGWSFALQDYYAENITVLLDTPAADELARIVDPYYYMDRLTMPKMAIVSVGDEFQLPDDSHRWFNGMPDETHMLVVQNAEHSLATGITEVLAAASGFVEGVVHGVARPRFSWSLDPVDGRITVKTQDKPKSVTMWFGSTVDGKRRDFRWAAVENPCYTVKVFGGCLRPILWFSQQLAEREEGTYVAAMAPPLEGWRAFFVELKFPNPAGSDFIMTTEVSIVPNTLPFPDCQGETCMGELV